MELQRQPVILVLTRQAIPTLDRTRYAPASGLAKGAYVLADAEDDKPEVLLLASGSEVSLCVDAYEELKRQGIHARVVSMPAWRLFEQQSQEYRDSVLPPEVTARVSVEQATTFGWSKYVGLTGTSLGIDTYGASAPLKDLLDHFGFTVDRVVAAAKQQWKFPSTRKYVSRIRHEHAMTNDGNGTGEVKKLAFDSSSDSPPL